MNLEVHHGSLFSSVQGVEFEVIDEDLYRLFRLRSGRIMPEKYISGEEKAILEELLRPADQGVQSSLLKNHLKRKYSLLFDIITRVILGITFSHDALTTDQDACIGCDNRQCSRRQLARDV